MDEDEDDDRWGRVSGREERKNDETEVACEERITPFLNWFLRVLDFAGYTEV